MYLTDKKNGVVRHLEDHEELEVLLESFSKQVEEIVNEAESIQVRKNPRSCSCAFLITFPSVERPIYPGICGVDFRF